MSGIPVRVMVVGLLMGCMASLCRAEAPRGWRTDGTGRYPQADPVLEWGADRNVIWQAPLEAWSNATPVVVAGRVFVGAEPSTLMCFDAATGELLWQRSAAMTDVVPPEQQAELERQQAELEVIDRQRNALNNRIRQLGRQGRELADDPNADPAERDAIPAALREAMQEMSRLEARRNTLTLALPVQPPRTHGTNGYSSPTPIMDGRWVYVLYGTGVIAAYDMQGRRQWLRQGDQPTDGWGHSASPRLIGGRLIVHVKDVVALDARTGDELWRTPSREKWGTDAVGTVDGVDIIVTASGDVIRASDGRKLASSLRVLDFGAPLLHEGVAYFIQGNGQAYRLGIGSDGELTHERLWQLEAPGDRYYASPLIHEGLIYAINRQGVFSVIDADSGEVTFSQRLELGRGTTYPSLVLAGRHLLVSHDNGTTLVFEPGRQPRQVGSNQLDGFRSTPVFDGDRMYVRTLRRLYAIGRP